MAKPVQGARRDVTLIVMVIACVVAVAVMVVALCTSGRGEATEFVPPPFEEDAVVGVPEVEDGRGYSELYQEGMAYRVSLCGNVHVTGQEAEVYLTNAAENAVWLKLRVLGADGEVLGETGLIKPGEYVKSVQLNAPLPKGEGICLKVMGYEPGSYHSLGALTLTPMVTLGE